MQWVLQNQFESTLLRKLAVSLPLLDTTAKFGKDHFHILLRFCPPLYIGRQVCGEDHFLHLNTISTTLQINSRTHSDIFVYISIILKTYWIFFGVFYHFSGSKSKADKRTPSAKPIMRTKSVSGNSPWNI